MKQFLEIPARMHNAIIILCFLAGYKGRYAASLSFISRDLRLSYDFLEQIMPALKRAGLVAAYRGSAGGYRLAKKAAAVSVWDVAAALDGRLRVAECVGGKCAIEKKCPSKKIYMKLQNELKAGLKKIKISDFK